MVTLVSIVIVTFNGMKYLQDCLSSVLAQTYPNIEVILVDNASSDGSAEFVEKQFPSVRLIRNSSNLGFAAGNNVGIRLTHGDYVVLLNQDTKADKRWIEELVFAAETDRDTGMCASKLLYMYEPDRINSTGFLLCRDLAGFCRGIGEIDKGQYEKQEEVLLPYGAAACYRKAMLNEIGLFDEDYFLLGEEVELALRGRIARWKCIYVPKAVVYHVRSANTRLYSPLKLYYGERNRIWNVVKFLPLELIITSFFFTLLRYAAMILFAFRGKEAKARGARQHSLISLGFTLMKAWLDACFSLPKMFKKRRQIQQAKKVSNQEIRSWLKHYSATLKDTVER